MAQTDLNDIIYIIMAFIAIIVESIFFLFCFGGIGSYLMGDVGILIGVFVGFSVSFLIGKLIYRNAIKNVDEVDKIKEEAERIKRQQEYEISRILEAQSLARKYPEATKYYFKLHWGITKSFISDYDITYDKVEVLLGHRDSYEQEEQRQNAAYRQKVEAEREARRKAEQEAAERKRREEERERIRKEAEIRNLINTLPACVSSWNSHSNSSIKHKYFYDYYPYGVYKDYASSSMWDTWKTVWHFKNDPSKNVSSIEHRSALHKVVDLVEGTLRSTFGSKTEYLTLVCLTASTQRKTELRFKEFADRVCSDLKMTNAFPYINVAADGSAKHEGGTGVGGKTYNRAFFNGKSVVLFDDVRTSGSSLEQERRNLESLGAKVICAITIAQTTH